MGKKGKKGMTTFPTNRGPVEITDLDKPLAHLTYDNFITQTAYRYSWTPELGYGKFHVSTPGYRERVVPWKPYRVRLTDNSHDPSQVVDVDNVVFEPLPPGLRPAFFKF